MFVPLQHLFQTLHFQLTNPADPRATLGGPDAGFVGALVAAGAGPVCFRDSIKFCQNTRIGLATKTDEYVPTKIPHTRANENPFSTCPPKRNNASAVSS